MKQIISKKAAEPVGSYPHAKKAGNLLFLSGIGPRKRGEEKIPGVILDRNKNIISYNIREQTHGVIENMIFILEESGLGLKDLVDIQVYLTNMKKDFKDFNQVYSEYFSIETGPARTTVEVGSLPTPIAVEFKAIASLV